MPQGDFRSVEHELIMNNFVHFLNMQGLHRLFNPGMSCFRAALFCLLSATLWAQPSTLRVEYLENPLGIDAREPRLSWVVPNTVRGDVQTAYRIRVSSKPGGAGDLWDSGKVASDQSIHVKYQGRPLRSGQRCYWTVETFGRDRASQGVSEAGAWTMGLLDSADWKGSWIGAGKSDARAHIWYRKNIELGDAPEHAFAYVSSLGFHELYINGEKADDRVMAPTLTALDKRVHYVTYDLSKLLRKGKNTIAIWYGPGWTTFRSYSKIPRGFRAQINIEGRGQNLSVATDDTWKWETSSSEHLGGWGHTNAGGETITASRLEPDWNLASYDDSNWTPAQAFQYGGKLTAEMTPPDRVIEEIPVVNMVKTDLSYEFSLEKNFTGFVEVALKGRPNTNAVIKIKDDRKNDPGGKYGEFGQTSQFQFDATGAGIFRNRFNYMAGCEIEITGVTGEPVLKAYAVSNDLRQIGSFDSSNALLNKIYETDLWTFRATTINGVTMDCPHRERLGYGEVAFATSWGIGLPNYESGAYYTKLIQGWMDVQHADGSLYFVAPTPNKTWGGPLWSSAPLTLTYELYRANGDTAIIRRSYATMKRWLDFLDSKLVDGTLVAYEKDNEFLGEWAAPKERKNNGNSPEAALFNNCVYAMILDMFVEMAGAIGNQEDAALYTARNEVLRAKVHAKFFNESENNYINNIQTHLAAPLLAGVTPSDKRAAVMRNLEKEILETKPFLDMGSSGLPILLKFLIEDAGRSDIVAKHLNKETHPSYGYFLSRGETTWPEYWSSTRPSKIHTCFTGIASFFPKGALSIQNADGSVGMKRFRVEPLVCEELDWARGTTASMYGIIEVSWKKQKQGAFSLTVTVPGNTTAAVSIPKPATNQGAWKIREGAGVVWENRAFANHVPGIESASENEKFVTFTIGSGKYQFTAE